MYKVTKYPHGTFSWADCNSTDVVKTKSFYTALMGWEIEDIPMGGGLFYSFCKTDGETVTALSPMMAEMQAQGIPSHWSNYITVDDVDALIGKVKELGGQIIAEPFDVFDSGRMMAVQDPTGAMINFWQANNHIGAYMVNVPGAMTWNELITGDLEKAKEFYGKLLGWEYSMDDANVYATILNNGRPNGGMMQMEGMMPVWMVYFAVADIEDNVEKTKTLGGTVIRGVGEAAGVGRFAISSDPTGATCAFIQLEGLQGQPWEG